MKPSDKIKMWLLLIVSITLITIAKRWSTDGNNWESFLNFALTYFGCIGLIYLGARLQQLIKILDKKPTNKNEQ
jgi:hypothetical protein